MVAVLLFVNVLAYGLYAGFLLSVAFIEKTYEARLLPHMWLWSK